MLTMLSNLCGKTFTIINQIPESDNRRKKVAWRMRKIKNCGKVGGVYDRSSGTMVKTSGEYTVYIKEPESYVSPAEYYASDNTDKFTLGKGDFIIFDDVDDAVPKNGDEYDALIDKYSDNGMTVSDFEIYINHKPDGTPWKTNHIEVIKR